MTSTPMDQYMVDLDERPWAAYAACRSADPELFFPGTDSASSEAVKICRSCAVQNQCLAWALDNRVRYGVWGGLTEQQRRRLTRFVA